MLVYLIGFMGSGKTTVARKVAAQLNWKFADLDRLIEARTGLSVEDIFCEKGEPFFREIESEVLRSIDKVQNMVVACGGGTPCFNDNMDFMSKTGFTIYLKMSVNALKNRLSKSVTVRPIIKNLAGSDLSDYIERTVTSREKHYSRAEVIVDGLDADISEIILEVRSHLSYNP